MGNCSTSKVTSSSIRVIEPLHTSVESLNEDPIQQTCKEFKMIDHKNEFSEQDFFSIQGLKVYYGEYIKGIQVTYSVNFQSKVLDIMGSGRHDDCHVVNFQENEFIDNFTFYYDDKAITALQISTTQGKKVFIGNEQNIPNKKETDLKGRERIIIGFKGLVGENLSNLWVYHAELDWPDAEDNLQTEPSDESLEF